MIDYVLRLLLIGIDIITILFMASVIHLMFWQTMRRLLHGRHRQAGPPAHGSTANRTDPSPRGSGQTFSSLATVRAKPPTPIPHAGIRTGEIIGYRLWWVVRENSEYWLCSLTHKRLWRPGETVEGDTNQLITINLNIGIDFIYSVWGGVYAYANEFQMLRELNHTTTRDDFSSLFRTYIDISGNPVALYGVAAGTVKMWGDVVEHERGYRAQYAKIESIDEVVGVAGVDGLRDKYLRIEGE
jgi:hypothetical protein